MHRILLREVVIDVPSVVLEPTQRFWAAALDATARPLEDHREFVALDDPAALPHVGIQDIGPSPARLHLDIESDDVPAEVARLVRLGAVEVRRLPGWVVLQDPAGLLFCVLPPESAEFAERSRQVQ
jgi:Glyoxalase-like domain